MATYCPIPTWLAAEATENRVQVVEANVLRTIKRTIKRTVDVAGLEPAATLLAKQ